MWGTNTRSTTSYGANLKIQDHILLDFPLHHRLMAYQSWYSKFLLCCYSKDITVISMVPAYDCWPLPCDLFYGLLYKHVLVRSNLEQLVRFLVYRLYY